MAEWVSLQSLMHSIVIEQLFNISESLPLKCSNNIKMHEIEVKVYLKAQSSSKTFKC